MSWFEYGKAVKEFHKALYDNGWVVSSFDWPKWQNKAKKYVNSPARIESAKVEAIQKLFTTHVRKERFCEGHLAAMLENGHIVPLLRRLQKLRGEMKSSPEDGGERAQD